MPNGDYEDSKVLPVDKYCPRLCFADCNNRYEQGHVAYRFWLIGRCKTHHKLSSCRAQPFPSRYLPVVYLRQFDCSITCCCHRKWLVVTVQQPRVRCAALHSHMPSTFASSITTEMSTAQHARVASLIRVVCNGPQNLQFGRRQYTFLALRPHLRPR